MSADELAGNHSQGSETPLSTGGTGSGTNATVGGPFRFPKTKKSLMSDWLQESESNSVADDDDVSANYLKGSRSPPGIATHLLRSASTTSSPVKNVCSAKKRLVFFHYFFVKNISRILKKGFFALFLKNSARVFYG